MLRNATWALSNFCRSKNPYPDFELVKQCLPVLARLIYNSDADVLADACWTLSFLSDGPNKKIQAVIDSGVCRRVVELLRHTSSHVVSAALRVVGNIVTGDDHQTQVIINANALPELLHLLSHQKDNIVKEACWTLSNITAGNRQQIEAVIQAKIMPVMSEMLGHRDFKVRKEAAWTITNATTGGTLQQIAHVVECNVIQPLCDLLSIHDAKGVLVALTAIENILKAGEELSRQKGVNENPFALQVEKCGGKFTSSSSSSFTAETFVLILLLSFLPGLDKIEILQAHDNHEVYQKVFDIISNFFTEDDDTGLVPEVEDNQFAFGGSGEAAGGGGDAQQPQQPFNF